MDMMLFIGTTAATRALRKGGHDQADEFAALGLLPLAAAMRILTEFFFAPLAFWQDQIAQAIQASVPSAD